MREEIRFLREVASSRKVFNILHFNGVNSDEQKT